MYYYEDVLNKHFFLHGNIIWLFSPNVSFYTPSFHFNCFASCMKTFKSTTNLHMHLYKWSVAFKRHVRFRGANISICLVQHKDNGLAKDATAAYSMRSKWSWQSLEMEGTCIPLSGCNCIPPRECRGRIVLAQQIEAAGADADGRGGQGWAGPNGERVVLQIHVIELAGITLSFKRFMMWGKTDLNGEWCKKAKSACVSVQIWFYLHTLNCSSQN